MRIPLFFTLIATLILAIGCSNGASNPTIPNSDSPIPVADNQNPMNHELLGMYQLNFNPGNMEVMVNPCRESAGHLNVKSLIPAPTFDVISFDPIRGILTVNATIRNPHTINGYDLRLIIFTDDLGVRLLNPDAWTSLFDIPGGSQINPFKAYAKNKPNRIFEAQTQNTETLQLYMPGGYTMLNFAVDASYPTNCEEPYGIENFKQLDVLTEGVGSSTEITVDILDWQGNVKNVNLYCPSITGQPLISLSSINGTTWGATIINATGISPGDYIGYIIATSLNSGSLAIYNDVMITVKKETGWARTWGGSEFDYADDVAMDESGNVFVTGEFQNTVDFDPGPNTAIRISNGATDTYLSKFDGNGNFKWVVTWGNNDFSAGYGITTDNAGNVLVAGYFRGTVDFDPGSGQDIHVSNGDRDVLVSKFDTNGNYLWGRSWGGLLTDGVNGITVDNSDNVYETGYFCETVNFNPRGVADNRSSNGGYDVFLTKLTSDGDYSWTLTWGGTNHDEGDDLMINDNGEIFCTGYFGNIVDFDPGTGIQLRSSNGDADCYLSKFDSNGIFQWVGTWGGVGFEACPCLNLDHDGNVLVGGNFQNSVDFDPSDNIYILSSNGGNDAFANKFDSDGNFIWARSWGGIAEDGVFELGIDDLNNIYATGGYTLTVDFDPGSGSVIRSSAGDADIYLNKLDSNGDFLLVQTWGGVGTDAPIGMSKECSYSAYVVGMFVDRFDFDPGADTDIHISNGDKDAFLMKVLPNGYWE